MSNEFYNSYKVHFLYSVLEIKDCFSGIFLMGPEKLLIFEECESRIYFLKILISDKAE